MCFKSQKSAGEKEPICRGEEEECCAAAGFGLVCVSNGSFQFVVWLGFSFVSKACVVQAVGNREDG